MKLMECFDIIEKGNSYSEGIAIYEKNAICYGLGWNVNAC